MLGGGGFDRVVDAAVDLEWTERTSSNSKSNRRLWSWGADPTAFVRGLKLTYEYQNLSVHGSYHGYASGHLCFRVSA